MILFPNTTIAQGTELLRLILRGLGARRVNQQVLSAVAGLTSVVDPGELPHVVKKRVDAIQYRAKAVSKSQPPTRFGALAVDGQDAIERFKPTPT